jgi:uncharacterized membrane protein YcaP (DUF421 family)
MFFDSWSDLLRVVVVGAAGYAALVLVLRLSGKRTLSKLNAFDLAVTVALGSTLATLLLSSDVSWSEGAMAFVVLAVLQLVVASFSVRLPGRRSVVTAGPSVLVRDGQVDVRAVHDQRLTLDEVRQAVRSSGVGGFDQVAAVVLESDGSLSVVTAGQRGDGSVLPWIANARQDET